MEQVGSQFAPAPDSNLVEDGREIALHGLERKCTAGPRFRRSRALQNQPRDFALAARELVGAQNQRGDLRRSRFLEKNGRLGVRAGPIMREACTRHARGATARRVSEAARVA